MKSTNVRQLMNILSDKYFGNDLNYTSNKSTKTQLKSNTRNQQSSYSALSPVLSRKLSPNFSRTSSLSQIKKNEAKNYFEESRSILQQTKNVLNRPTSSFNKNEKKRLQLKQMCDNEIGSDKKIGNESYQYTYTRKYSHKDLSTNNQVDLSSYLTPAAFGANKNSKDLKKDDKNGNINVNVKQVSRNTNSRLIKQSITQSKGANGKRLFLRENPSELSKVQSNSTIQNLRSSKYIEEQDQKQYYTEHQPISLTRKQKQQLQFYKQKCFSLQQQNSCLKQKVSLYEQQFNQQKQMVENLKNMINQRDQEINQVINKKLSEFDKKQQLLQSVQNENETLKNQLNNVRQLLRQQQAIIIELYSKNKNKPIVMNEYQTYQASQIKNKPTQNGKNTLTSLTSHCSSSSRHKNQSRPYVSSYIDSNARESIEESSFEDE